MFAVGSLVAGYRIEQIVATGATGTVYVAKNPTLPRRDALKVLSADLSRDAAFRERFVREADIASLLDHPNIVSIHNRGEAENGQPWIAMQYIAGTDAEAALQAGTMTALRAIRIVGEVAKALNYAHQRNVVHHDVKPGNVLLAHGSHDDEQVLLSDFGVARAAGGPDDPGDRADDSMLAVTLAYAAPEVITGSTVDGRADIYSLACTLFRLLTGKQPFYSAQGTTAVARAHLHETPPRISAYLPEATRQLDVVMARALAKDPAERFSSAREFAAAAAAAAAPLTKGTVQSVTRAQERPNRMLPNGYTVLGARFDDAIRIAPKVRKPRVQRPIVILGSICAVLATLAAVLWTIYLWPWSDSPGAAPPATSTTATTSGTAEATALDKLLPPGYPRGTCTPAPTDAEVVAAMSCGPNTDSGGPTSSTYTLSSDLAALRAAFTETVNRTTPRICPPNIQSPGPWRRNDSPTVVRGTVFCGLQAGRPVVIWTEDDELLLSVVQAQTPTATLEDLYAWWSSHS
jgi:serine/threonine-protein kinase